MSGAERDIALDPRPGDVIAGYGLDGVRRFISVDFIRNGEVFYWQSDDQGADRVQSGSLRRVPLGVWSHRAATAEVVHRAEVAE